MSAVLGAPSSPVPEVLTGRPYRYGCGFVSRPGSLASMAASERGHARFCALRSLVPPPTLTTFEGARVPIEPEGGRPAHSPRGPTKWRMAPVACPFCGAELPYGRFFHHFRARHPQVDIAAWRARDPPYREIRHAVEVEAKVRFNPKRWDPSGTFRARRGGLIPLELDIRSGVSRVTAA
jgi:hypothetical protein